MEEIRLQKYLSDIGIMSRRAAEREIESGNVRVNGEIATLGMKIRPGKNTSITIKGKKIKPLLSHRSYVMLNKPRGYVTTLSDEKGRKCINELISDIPERVYPVGRLDLNSEGLLLLTNDGELTNILTHPGHEITKTYLVRVIGEISREKLKQLSSPMEIDGYVIKPVKVTPISANENTTLLKMELSEGRNRQIRKMCEKCDIGVATLKRICEGALKLGDLPSGKWRYLTRAEIEYLKSLKD